MNIIYPFTPLLIILLSIFNGIYPTEADADADADLDFHYGHIVFSSVIFRHGSRSPAVIYPLNPYNESFWPQGLNQLTNEGKLEGYELGVWLRKRYIKLLGETYNLETIYTMSAELDKSMMTAECFLAGLYPPSESEIWKPNLNWQPIPVHSITSTIDNILSSTKPCDNLEYQQLLLNDVPYYQELIKENIPLLKIVSKYTGVYFNVNMIYQTITDISYIYDTINIQEANNLTSPTWVSSISSSMMNFALQHFTIPYYNLESQRLRVGPFLKLMIHNMTNKVDGTLQPDRTLAIYSAREANLVGILTVLGLYTTPPSPSSCLMIELRKLNDSYNVLFLYKNSSGDNVNVMEIPECPSPCTLQKFIEVTEKFIPQDWDTECELTSGSTSITVFGVIVVAVIILATVVLFLCCLRNVRSSSSKSKYENI